MVVVAVVVVMMLWDDGAHMKVGCDVSIFSVKLAEDMGRINRKGGRAMVGHSELQKVYRTCSSV